MGTSPVDLSDLSTEEALYKIGELVQLLFRRSRVVLLAAKPGGALTVLNPVLLAQIPDEDVAVALLDADWEEKDIEEFLGHLNELKEKQ